MMSRLLRSVSIIALTAGLGGCWGQVPEPIGAQYFQRRDTVTLGAGDAKDVNAAVHVIDPWAPHSANVRIPGQGERMVNTIEQYNKNRPQAAQQSGSAPSASGTAATPSSASANSPPSSTLPY